MGITLSLRSPIESVPACLFSSSWQFSASFLLAASTALDISSSFFTHRFFPSSSQSRRQLRQAFVPDTLSYPLGGTHQPSWQVADMGTMYRKRASQPKKAPTKEQQCQLEGEVCLFSNGLLGGAIKLPCCPTSSCVFAGERFRCVRDISEDYSDYDQIKLHGDQE